MTLLIEQAKLNVVTIREYETSRPLQLDPRALRLLNALPTGRLDVRPSGEPGWFVLVASSWVGSIALPNLTIRIHPKVKDLRNVLMMFGSAAGLVDWQSDVVGHDSADLVEGVVELVLRSIGAATRRGLVHGYSATERRLPVIRGRLDVQQLVARPWDTWPVPCRFDEFTADVAENRVLLATVKQLGRLTSQASSRRVANELVQRLAEAGDAASPLFELDQVRTTPVNEHYAGALSLCRLALEGIGLTHAVGGHQAVTFLVDMNQLYERWIGTELTLRLWPDLEVAEQHHTPLSLKPRVGVAPDLVFRRAGTVVLVADVKYKLTGGGLAKTEDYYQLLAYTTILELAQGVLIYCKADGAPERVITIVGGGQRLYTHPLDLSGDWSEVSGALDALAGSIKTLTSQSAQERRT